MATAILVPTGITDASANIASGAATDIDNGVDTPADGALVVTVLDEWVTGSVIFTMSDLPGDFDTVNTVQFRVRGQFVNPGSGDQTDYIFTLTGASLPATTTALWDEADDGSGFENFGAGSAEGNSATEAQINAWTVVLTQANYTKDKNPDLLYLNVSEIEIAIDYDAAVGGGATELDFERGATRGVTRGAARGAT